MVYPNIASCFVDSVDYLPSTRGEIPDSWERFVTLDHGLRNPTAVYFHAINPNTGEVVTYEEYYVANRLVPEHAKELLPRIQKIPYGKLRFMVADPSIRNKTDPVNGKSVQALYQEYGLYFQPGNNNIEAGILKVNSYIERGKWKIFRDKCPNLCREAINYKFPELSMDNANKNLDEKPVKVNDHAMDSCFVAGTLIETDKGQVPIEHIRVGDKVLTRKGYKTVIDWGMTNRSATVYTVKFSNGSSLTGTANHPVWVEGKGFCTIDSLRYGDIVKISPNWREDTCQQLALLNGTVKSGVETINLTTLNIRANNAAQRLWQTSMTSGDFAPVHVVSVHVESQKQAVYNLSVDEVPEYYANGVLVHNCRYGFMRLPDDPDMLKTIAYEPQRRYNYTRNVENEYNFDPSLEEFEEHLGRDWTSYV